MKDNIIKIFIRLSVISYFVAWILFLFNQNFQNWGFWSLLIIGLLVMIVEFMNLFNKKFEIFNRFTILDSYQKWILEILIWFSPLLFMIYYSFYSSEFNISGMLWNLAGWVLLTGLLIMIVEVTTFLSKQKPRIVASLVNGIYKMLFFLKDKWYYEEIHKLSWEINDLLWDKINKNLKIDLSHIKEDSEENFVTHAKSYLNFAYFCWAILFDEKLEDISRLRFEKLDLTEQKKEIFEKIKEYKDKLWSKNKDDLDKIKLDCQKIIDKIFDDDEFQKTLFELANNFMDNDSMLSIREKRQIQNILFFKNAEIRKDKVENIKNTFQFILGFYLIFNYYLDKLAYYGEDIKEKEGKETSKIIKFIEPLKHFVITDSYWRSKIIEIVIYLGIGLSLLFMCYVWDINHFSEFWKSISENIIYGISWLIITIVVALKGEFILSKKDISILEKEKNLPILKNLDTKLSLDEDFKNFETYFDSDFFKEEVSYFYYFIEKVYNNLKTLFIDRENYPEQIIQQFKSFDKALDETEELINKFRPDLLEKNDWSSSIRSSSYYDSLLAIKSIVKISYDLPFPIDKLKEIYDSIYEKNSMKFWAITGFMGLLLLDINSLNNFINKNISSFFSTVSMLKSFTEISTRRYNKLRWELEIIINTSEGQKTLSNDLVKSLDNVYKILKNGIEKREKNFSKIIEDYPEILRITSDFRKFYNNSINKLSPIINMNVINNVIDIKSNLLDRGFFSQNTYEFYGIICMLNNDIYFSYNLSFIEDNNSKSFWSLLLLSSLTERENLWKLAFDLIINLDETFKNNTIWYDIWFLSLVESFEEHGISLDKMLTLDCNNWFRRLSELIFEAQKEKGSGLTKGKFYTLFEKEIKEKFLSDDYELLFGNSIEFKEKMSAKLNKIKEKFNELWLGEDFEENNPENFMNKLANNFWIRSLQEIMGVSKEELDKIMETFKEKLRTSYDNYYK